MKKQFVYFLFLCAACLLACSNPVDPRALELKPSEINRLIPFRGELNNGVRLLYPEEPYKAFWAENWSTPEQSSCGKLILTVKIIRQPCWFPSISLMWTALLKPFMSVVEN